MSNIYLLDCTLRDGGYVNGWNFGEGSIKSIFTRLDTAGVDSIEVGFIDERVTYDANRSIYPDTKSIEPVFENIQTPKALLCAMIDYGTCSLDKISPKAESHLDAIRIIFKKHQQDEALDFCARVKAKGYKIFVNPVSVTSYTDEEIIALVKKINKISPYAVTVVDTYGLMHSEAVLHYCNILNTHLDKKIIIGYHAHNNFQLAYSNAIAVMSGIENRDISIDGTLFGMGKSAGNACTELLAMYMNEFKGKNYDMNQIQEAIDVDIQKEFAKCSWGYKPKFYQSALYACHPNYVQYYMDKRSLSIKSINNLLLQIPDEVKLLYNEKIAEEIYQKNQLIDFDDSHVLKELQEEFSGRPLLLLGPGKTILKDKDRINNYINNKDPIIISLNFAIDDYPIDYIFVGNAKRYSQLFSTLSRTIALRKLICTSNITEISQKIDYHVNFINLVSNVEVIRDNPLVLFLNLLSKINIKNVVLAGFDGYVEDIQEDYYQAYIPFLYDTSQIMLRNEALKTALKLFQRKMTITSLTRTLYLEDC